METIKFEATAQCVYTIRGDLAHGCPKCGWGREADG